MTDRLLELPVKIFADGADFQGIAELAGQPYIDGVTTNPTLMRKAGLTDYESFARAVLNEVKVKPISFEVFSDDFSEMRRQALKMHQWQENIYVKIPITNTSGESSIPLIAQLAREGVKLNVTAVLTPRQVRAVAAALDPTVPDRKSTRLNSSHMSISYAVFCLKKKKEHRITYLLGKHRRIATEK